MSGVSGMGTTYNLPNYVGELFSLTPTETPFLTAVGGLSGGKSVASTKFSWQTDDNRDPQDRQRKEGETAPAAENRVRSKVENVTEIHQEKASVSYSKQAATQLLATPQSSPFTMQGGVNPIGNELDYQVRKAIEAIAVDVNYSFINGRYKDPSSNSDARRTRGIIEAIDTNAVVDSGATVVTGASSATDTITVTHALSANDKIVFTESGGADIVIGRVYWVKSVSTTVSFKIAATKGGAALTVGTGSGISFIKPRSTALGTADVDDLVQAAYDHGGVRNNFTATLWTNSTQKRAISAAYADKYGKATPVTRNVGGVVVEVIQTDFGTLNIALDRLIPVDMLLFCSMEQLNAAFTLIPGKGAFFEEPLAKTGASDEVQIYGEIGLEYGNEAAHGYVRGLPV